MKNAHDRQQKKKERKIIELYLVCVGMCVPMWLFELFKMIWLFTLSSLSFLFRPQGSPSDSKPSVYLLSSAKPSSPETAASITPADETLEPERPGTPVPSEEAEVSDNGTLIGLI